MFRPYVLNPFWPMDNLLKKYSMDNFAMLTPHEQPVETVLHIGQWACPILVLK